MVDQELPYNQDVFIPICGFIVFCYIPITASAFCPPPGSYLRKCLCDLAESWFVGMAMRWMIKNVHKIRVSLFLLVSLCIFITLP